MSEVRHKIKDSRWHVLNKPNVYIGSIQECLHSEYLIENGKMSREELVIIPALVKLGNEVLDNSVDILAKSKNGIIEFDVDDKSIRVKDNGVGMPITTIKDLDGSDILLPRAMWGKAMAGSNFNGDANDATTIGTNGVGSYCANVWSTKFIGKSCDGKQLYVGEWENNDTIYREKITSAQNSQTGCEVYFEPDLDRFKIDKIDASHHDIFRQRIINLSFLFNNITFKFNGKIIKWTKEDYIKTFTPEGTSYEMFECDNYSIVVMNSRIDSFETFSIMNGLNIKKGTHIDYVQKKVNKAIFDSLPKKLRYNKENNTIGIKEGDIKNKLQILVFGKNFPEIQWSGQTKEEIGNSNLELQLYYGDEWEKKLPKQVAKNEDIIKSITFLHEAKIAVEEKKQKKDADRAIKKNKALKLRDAAERYDFLALTEGDSALNGIISALGRDFIGFLPLKGVVLNVYSNDIIRVLHNQEYKDIMTALNLNFSTKIQEIASQIKYKNLVLMTDADHDGSHIQGLLIGFIQKFMPDLFSQGRIYRFLTPIKVAKDKKDKMVYAFLNEAEYEKAGKEKKLDKLEIEHKKGLGSLSPKEYKEFFGLRSFEECLEKLMVPDMDFSLLKDWLEDDTNFRKEQILKEVKEIESISTFDGTKEVTLNNFLDTFYREWAKYRAFQRIPHFVDLLAESQRKVIHTMLEKNITKKTSVEDLSSIVKIHTNYHHGGTSLANTIDNLVPQYNNNIPLIFEGGTFGTRSNREASAPRYTSTKLMAYTRALFPKIDNNFHNEQWDEGKKIEPETLLPILPIGLINGQSQIGVGWACTILPRDPKHIIKLIKDILIGKIKEVPEDIDIKIPKFKGKIFKNPNGGYQLQGVIKIIGTGRNQYIHITEVPTRYVREKKQAFDKEGNEKRSTSGYINILESLIEDKLIRSYTEKINGDIFDIKVKGFDTKKLPKDPILRNQKLLEIFKLTENKSDSISVIENKDLITQPLNIGEVLISFIKYRLDIYKKRKSFLLKKLQEDIFIMESKIKFIEGVNDTSSEKLVITKITDAELNSNLVNYKFKFFRNTGKTLIDKSDEDDNDLEIINKNPYQYLLDMKIVQLTDSNIKKFLKKILETKEELNVLRGITAPSMWIKDITEFEKIYDKQ